MAEVPAPTLAISPDGAQTPDTPRVRTTIDASPGMQQLLKDMGAVAERHSIPVRLPSYNAPSYWSQACTITKARPLPANTSWIDYLPIPNRTGHRRWITGYVATAFTADVVEYRWVKGRALLDPSQVQIPANVERHLNRNQAHPYPCIFRKTNIIATEGEQLVLQVRNLTSEQQLIYAAVIGWYYPALKAGRGIDADEGIDDMVRGFYDD